MIFVVCFSLLTACGDNKLENKISNSAQIETGDPTLDDQIVYSNTEKLTITTETEEQTSEDESLINEDGMTLESRISVPSGYQST